MTEPIVTWRSRLIKGLNAVIVALTILAGFEAIVVLCIVMRCLAHLLGR